MNMQCLFSTKERERMMIYILYNPTKKINLHEIARTVKISPSQAHKYISILRKQNIIKNNLLHDSVLIRSLRLTQNILKIENKKLVTYLKKSIQNIQGIGMYGSWSKGSNDKTADLDIWIKTSKEVDDLTIAKARRTLEKKFLIAIDLIVITPKQLEYFREKNPSFYFSLYNSIKLWGEGL